MCRRTFRWYLFDDAELQDSSTSIQLVTAVHPKYQLGRITAKHLLRMMEDPEWQSRKIIRTGFL